MGTFQEKSIADSSTYSFWQNENTRSGAGYAAKHHHDKRFVYAKFPTINISSN